MNKDSCNDALLHMGVKSICIPFYQIWQEMLGSRTIDVYKYRVLTPLAALIEIKSVIAKTLGGIFTNAANIEACREELLYLVNMDPIFSKYYPALQNRLRSTLGNNPKSEADQRKLQEQVSYTIKMIQPQYMVKALKELKASIDVANIDAICKYANIVASQAVFDGWSARGLFELLRFFKSSDTFDVQWSKFYNELNNSVPQDYTVLISIPFKNNAPDEAEKVLKILSDLNIDIRKSEEIISQFNTIPNIKNVLKAGKSYFAISVKAQDVYIASHRAITMIAEKLNFASFYNLVDAWNLQSTNIIPISTLTGYFKSLKAEQLYATHDYIESSGRVFEATKAIFSDPQKNAIRDKLQGAFGYTNMSRISLFQEEKFMNLWVALESLSRTEMYSNIISNIKETVPAAMSMRYIYRIIRNFVEDCKRCNVSLNFSTITVDPDQFTKQKMVKEMISVFQDDSAFSELQGHCQHHSMLNYRTAEIKKMLTDISFATKKIENHYKRIRWQIQRLYRIRNEIAHAALREQTSLVVYIEHLYSYLSTYISEIVSCIAGKGLESIEEAICLIKDSYDVFISFSNGTEASLLKETVLKTGIIEILDVDV